MRKMIVGITGASGIIYGYNLLKALNKIDEVETHLIISSASIRLIKEELLNVTVEDLISLADYNYDINNLAAPISSGSFKTDGMIVAPCTVKTLSSIANSYTDNLITRAADVVLKERRRLVLLFRETPLNLTHINNMSQITMMGGIILPPVPAFYHKPERIEDIVNQTVGKTLDLFQIDNSLFKRWGEN